MQNLTITISAYIVFHPDHGVDTLGFRCSIAIPAILLSTLSLRVTVTDSRLASNAVVSSLFDGASTHRTIYPLLDARSDPSGFAINGVVQRAEVLNQKNPDIQYHAAWSNECIEFWFMLHFAYYTANNHRSEYKKFMNEKFQELGIGKYEKNMDNIFETLMNGGNPKLAIRYAKRIIKNGEGKTPAEIAPGTKVYELVEELAKYLPEEQKKCFM